MNYNYEKQLERIKEEVGYIEDERQVYLKEREWLFRQIDKEITFLLDHLVKNESLQDSQHHQDTLIETHSHNSSLNYARSHNAGTNQQVQSTIIRQLELQIRQKDQQINYFIQKLQKKDQQIERIYQKIEAYEEKVEELRMVIERKEKQLSEDGQLVGKRENVIKGSIEKLKPTFQYSLCIINSNNSNTNMSTQYHDDDKLKKQLQQKLSRIQTQRDVKIQQLELIQKHIEHMKLMYERQNQTLLRENKILIQNVVKEKDSEILAVNSKLLQNQIQYKKLTEQQLTRYQQKLTQLNERHRNEIDEVSAKYQKQIIKLSSKYQTQMDQITFNSNNQRKQLQSIYAQLEKRMKEMEEQIITKQNNNNKQQRKQIINDKNIKQLYEQIQLLQNKLCQQSKFLQQKTIQLQKYQIQQKSALKQLNQLLQQNIQLQNKNSKLITTNTFLQQKNLHMFNQLQKTNRIHQQKSIIANKRLQFLQSQLQQNKITIQQSKKQISSLNAMIETLTNELNQKDIKLESLDRQLQRTKNYTQILLTDVKTLNSDVKTLNSKIHQLDQYNIEMKKAVLTSRQHLQNKRYKQIQSRILSKSFAQESMADRNKSRKHHVQYDQIKRGEKNNKNSSISSNKQNQSLLIERKDRSLVMDDHNASLKMSKINNSMVIDADIDKQNDSMMAMDNSSVVLEKMRVRAPSSSFDKQSKTKYRINITEQLKKKWTKREQMRQQLQVKQLYDMNQQQQQQLQHLYSMETTFSAMPIPSNIRPITNNNSHNNNRPFSSNSNNSNNSKPITEKQDRISMFKKTNQRLADYRQRTNHEKERRERSHSNTLRRQQQEKNISGNMSNLILRQKYAQDHGLKVSEQFKHVLTAYEQKKNQLQEFSRVNQQILNDNDQINSQQHSTLQGEYQYEDLQLTFKPITFKQPNVERNSNRNDSKFNTSNNNSNSNNKNNINLLTVNKYENIIHPNNNKDSIADNNNLMNRYLSLNSSFDDQNNVTQEDINSNNLRPSVKERIMRQLPVHLLIGK